MVDGLAQRYHVLPSEILKEPISTLKLVNTLGLVQKEE